MHPGPDDTIVTVSMDVVVTNRQVLRRAALERAIEDKLTGNEWRAIRRSREDPSEADLIMLLDPSSLPGATIIESNMETY